MNNKQEGTITEKNFENILGNDVVGKSYAKECFELTKQYTSSLLSEKDKQIEGIGNLYRTCLNEIASLKSQLSEKDRELKSQSGSKSGYGELLEWVEKETDIIRSEADGNSYNVIYSDELIAKILSLSSTDSKGGYILTDDLKDKISLAIRENEHEVMDELACEETTDKIISLLETFSSKEGSKVDIVKLAKEYAEHSMRYFSPTKEAYKLRAKNSFIAGSELRITPPTSKVEAKPSQQEGEKIQCTCQNIGEAENCNKNCNKGDTDSKEAAGKKPMSIEKCKDVVAINHGYDSWNEFCKTEIKVDSEDILEIINEAITLYANQSK